MDDIGIYHNNNDRAEASGYSPGDELTLVYRFDTAEVDFFDQDREDTIYGLFSRTAEPMHWSRHPCSLDYLSRGNRPLRPGDVIELEGSFWARTPEGFWDELEAPRLRALKRAGTEPFSAPVISMFDPLDRSLLSLFLWANGVSGPRADDDELDPDTVVNAVLSFLSTLGFRTSKQPRGAGW